MSTTRILSTLAVSAALLTACADPADPDPAGSGTTPSSSETSAETTPAASEPEEPDDALADAAPDGRSIQDGTWSRTATLADAERLGIPRNRYRPFLGADGEVHVELRIDDDDFGLFSDDGNGEGDGTLPLGDYGTAGYDADGHWVITSNSAGCFGCVITMDWTVKGRRLTLAMVDTTESGDPVDILISRLVSEGTYTRAG